MFGLLSLSPSEDFASTFQTPCIIINTLKGLKITIYYISIITRITKIFVYYAGIRKKPIQ